ncbi:MAG: pyridoxal phosphate-dependent aminotransferase [Paludibacteraceae bacterium]|jgi:aspartate/methionine/tyrosine aminotransferase|nr:pyridoxal phosphate-dependent aminotransferase [Paludibacteraceae bacterium]
MVKINPLVEQMTSFIVMDVLERAQELEREGKDIVHLEVGEPDFDLSEMVREAAEASFAQKRTHYTHSLGDKDLRLEVARFYQREYGVTIDPDQVIVTSGSSPAILMALMVLCEPGSEVILSDPGYPCYKNFVLACNAKPVSVDLSPEDGFQYSIEKIKKAITPKTRAIFVNSPMNPTGTLVSDATYKELVNLGIPLLSDEIYHGLVYEGRAKSALEFTDNAFVLNGFSKRYAMTGLRLGFLVAPKEYVRKLQVIQQNLFICAPSISQRAGIVALRDSEPEVAERRAIYDERRRYMLSRLKNMGFEVEVEPQGAFYIFCNAKKFTTDSYRFAFEVLENAHVGITPGVDFGKNGEGYVRFSYANSLDNIKKGMDRLETYLQKL